jgi:hypothetical protein
MNSQFDIKGLTGLVPDNLSDEIGSPGPAKSSLRKDSSVGDLPKSASSIFGQSQRHLLNGKTKLELLMGTTKTSEGSK